MTLSGIRNTVRELRLSPSRRLGQNFLHDKNLARWIVDQAEITPDDYVVEIGPGLGALTGFILDKGAQVIAIEKDTRLVNFLRARFDNPRLEVIDMDALKFEPRSLFAHRKVKLLGNVPYKISSALLLKFIELPSPIALAVLMLQKEMAARLSALPSTPAYGALTLRVQLSHCVNYLRTVPATVFFPRPKIDSAIVAIAPRDVTELPQRDNQLLLKLIAAGFAQRRKQLRKLLRNHINDWDAAARALNIAPKVRAEELSLLQWIGLANLIAPPSSGDTRLAKYEQFPVVDKTDRVLRHASRSEVHANNLWHRAVHILVFNQAGEVYLQQRSRGKDRHPLKWDSSAAGHVGVDERYDHAAQRELREELGVAVPLQNIAKLPASEHTDQEFVCVYQGTVTDDLTPNRAEIEQGAFLRPTIVDGWTSARPEDFAPAFLECWKLYRQKHSEVDQPRIHQL